MAYTTEDHILNGIKMIGGGLIGGPVGAFAAWVDTGRQMLEAEKAEKAEQRQREAEEAARKAQQEAERQRQIHQQLRAAYETFDRTRNTNENEAWNNLYLTFYQIQIF